MSKLTRRDLLTSSLAASAVAAAGDAAGQTGAAKPPAKQAAAGPAPKLAGKLERERLLLDFGWRFHPGNANDQSKDFDYGGNRGSEETFAKSGGFLAVCNASFDDKAWQKVDLPHDWAVALPFENANPLIAHGAKPLGRNYPETSIGWYRRVFDIPADDTGRRFTIDFDGVFRRAMVIFNGHYLGENFSGYAPFSYDVTDFVNFGSPNVLVVRVDATLNEGWFYEGAGIYRHVWLNKTSPVHVAQWGTFVRSEVKAGAATVTVTTEVQNETDEARMCQVASTIVDAKGKVIGKAAPVGASIPPRGSREIEQRIAVANPALWSIEEPNLYTMQTAVETGGAVTDRCETSFGIRTLAFDADKGFFLNGKHVQIKGTCNHQDHGGVGAAVPDRVNAYRVERLKEMCSNGIRTSHNPPTTELLDACDKLGMLVMDETRMMDSSPEGLSQLERLIRRDRNHPCVFIWSLGNEEREQGSERGKRIVTTMKRLARKLDPSRLVTVAQNGGYGPAGISTVVDVGGFNYNERSVDGLHKSFPKLPLFGSETASTVCTRGWYAGGDASKLSNSTESREASYVSAYDANRPGWASLTEVWWKFYDERPFLAGGFAWTGFDYRGEPTPFGWPCVNSHFGILDMCGFPKDNFYYYTAWWGSKPSLHVFPHWNWNGKEGQNIDVWVHSNLDRVELFLNGQSLGSQSVVKNTHLAWKVKYAPGTLEARGYKGSQVALTEKRETTGPAAKIVLRPDRATIDANGEDCSMVTVEIQDAQGRVVPTAENEVTFQVSGAGALIGLCNGNPTDHEIDKSTKRKAFAGLAMAIVQAGKQVGDLRIEASSAGLAGATVMVACQAAKARPALA